MPVVFTCMLEGNVSKVTKKRYSFKEEYAISQTPQVVLDHHVRDDLGYLKISWDYMHFTGLSGRHSVLERPLYEVNGRPFFSQKTTA